MNVYGRYAVYVFTGLVVFIVVRYMALMVAPRRTRLHGQHVHTGSTSTLSMTAATEAPLEAVR